MPLCNSSSDVRNLIVDHDDSDVLVVGAGVTGLAVSRFLSGLGSRVSLVDSGIVKERAAATVPNSVRLFSNFTVDSLAEFDQIKFAVTESRLPNELCFSNHVMYKDTDETIKKWGTINNKKIPSKVIKYIEKQADKLKVFYKWKKNEIIMLDNRRFLHGRNFFSKNEKRKIINIQTLKTNFSYEHIKNI